MVGGDTLSMVLYCCRLLGLGECDGGGNLPEESRLGIVLSLPLLPPGGNLGSDFSVACFCCSSSVFATGDGGLGCIMEDVISDASSRSLLLDTGMAAVSAALLECSESVLDEDGKEEVVGDGDEDEEDGCDGDIDSMV